MIGYLDKVIRPLILIMPQLRGYVKAFEVKGGDKDKKDTLMSFCRDDGKLLEKYKAIWTKIKHLKNIDLNALSVFDESYLKTKIEHTEIKFILTIEA